MALRSRNKVSANFNMSSMMGIILGSFLGSFLGAKIESIKNPVHIAFGTVIGFMFGSVLKFVLSMYILLLIFIK